jgi:hypothetical protein
MKSPGNALLAELIRANSPAASAAPNGVPRVARRHLTTTTHIEDTQIVLRSTAMLSMHESLARERMHEAERSAARRRLVSQFDAKRRNRFTLMFRRQRRAESRDSYTLAG